MNAQWIGQGATNWCWATAAKMVAESYGCVNDPDNPKYPSIEELVAEYDWISSDEGGDVVDIAMACKDFTEGQWDFSYHEGKIYSEEMMRLFLDDGNPIVVCRKNVTDDLGHAIVVYGYYYQGDQCYFLFKDPWTNNAKDVLPKTHDELKEEIDDDEKVTRWKGVVVKSTAYHNQTS